MTAPKLSKASRMFVLNGVPGFGDDAELISFVATLRFVVEGKPPADDFLLDTKLWESLGKPRRIKVTVEAAV